MAGRRSRLDLLDLSITLRLTHNSLTFDFIGTPTDETADDLYTVQIPRSWLSAFLDFAFLYNGANLQPLLQFTPFTLIHRSRILTIGEVPKDQVYTMKLKGISVCFSMLKAALCGNYVNFGVFRLYGDNALDKAFGMFVKLLLSVSQRDLMDYPKLSQNFYSLLECLANDHMAFISSLEPQVFLYILATISEGLTALAYKWSSIQDTMVCTGCCATLDTVITYLFKNLTIKKKKQNHMQQNEAFFRILELHPEILQQMLSTVLNIIMFEDCRNQ
ncbi:exportin-7-B-like [Crassostrea angulata]|uniref:exportin-7-B-like n=1 Tax=Magallana angulata TaxID=2784310 RepID=UPI0022B1A566|nr:exportin-7-B-like [Crassostrea angulata]